MNKDIFCILLLLGYVRYLCICVMPSIRYHICKDKYRIFIGKIIGIKNKGMAGSDTYIQYDEKGEKKETKIRTAVGDKVGEFVEVAIDDKGRVQWNKVKLSKSEIWILIVIGLFLLKWGWK